MGKVVGIDLGTTNSVVAVMEGGKPVVIANAEGMRTTPSVVGVTKDGERIVGQMARRQAVLDPQNTFYGIKRFIGRRYAELNSDSKRVPYTIRKDESGNVRIKCPRLEKEFAPEEIAAMILKKLADEASRYLGEPITEAVITVPAYFNDSQRQATRDAGRIAGLEVKRILNEPTAASLAYGLDRQNSQTILVFDLGGGTFDVSILEVGDGVFQVKSTSGDTQLGGNDFDRKIVDWLAEQFLEQEGIDLRKDRQSLQRLTEAAEKAKIELSGVTVTEINLPFITATADGPKHLETRMTRSQFEGICGDLLSRLRAPVKQAMRDAELTPRDIDEVVLVGGSTRIPVVQDLVRGFIDREPNQNVNPDEVVAIGAAIQAGIMTGEIKDILLLDVTPLSLGLETIGGLMKKLIPRNTTIPVRRSDIFSTGEDNQTMVEVHVLQGEREMALGNKSLGRFKLVGIPPAPRGIPQIQVSFDIDANGILQVAAMDRTTGREQSITVQEASTLSRDEVARMIQEAEMYASEDQQRRSKVEKRNQAEALTFEAERKLREATLDFGMQFVSPYRSRVERLVQELRTALTANDDRGIDQAYADLYDVVDSLKRDFYERTREEKEQDSFLGAIKSFFTDDDDYYDDYYNRDAYGSGYGAGYNNNRDYGYGGAGSGSGYGTSRSYGNAANDRYGSSLGGSGSGNTYSGSSYSGGRDYGYGSGGLRSGNDRSDRPNDRSDRPNDRPSDRPDPYRSGRNDYGNADRPSERRSDSWPDDTRSAGNRTGESRSSDRYANDRYANDRSGESRPNDRYANDRYNDRTADSRSSSDRAGGGRVPPNRDNGTPRYEDPANLRDVYRQDRDPYASPETRNRNRNEPESGRSSYYGSPAERRDRDDRKPAPPSRRTPRPNLSEDNWDDEDDWL